MCLWDKSPVSRFSAMRNPKKCVNKNTPKISQVNAFSISQLLFCFLIESINNFIFLKKALSSVFAKAVLLVDSWPP